MNKLATVISCLLAVLLLVLVACAPSVAPVPVPQSPAAKAPAPAPALQTPAAKAPAMPAWQAEWERVLAAAKQEGRLVLYTSLASESRRMVTNPFQSKYGIRIESMTGAAAELASKISAEQRAGIYSGDVFISGSTTYITFKGLLDNLDSVPMLPELTEPELIKKTWYFGEVPWADKAHTMLHGLMHSQEFISTNTNLVKAGEIKAYRDLLDPKWKGKISLQDPRISSMGQMWFAVALELGDVDVNFMRELAGKQDIFVTRDRRLQLNWLAQGKHSIAIGPHTSTVTEFIELGAPINRFSVGTPSVSASSSGTAMMKRAPDPNAAKLFINWLLSPEGSILHSQAVGAQSQRLDVPTAHLEQSSLVKPGLKVFKSDNEEFAIKKDTDYIKLAKEIIGP